MWISKGKPQKCWSCWGSSSSFSAVPGSFWQFPVVSLKIPVFQKLLKAGESGLGDPNASLVQNAASAQTHRQVGFRTSTSLKIMLFFLLFSLCFSSRDTLPFTHQKNLERLFSIINFENWSGIFSENHFRNIFIGFRFFIKSEFDFPIQKKSRNVYKKS